MRLAAGATVFAIGVLAGLCSARETVKCPVTRDVWVSACSGETDFNMGSADKIKLKAYQEMGILDFDVSALKGRRIVQADLYLKPTGKCYLGWLAGGDVRWLTVSTVGHDWVEGKSTRYAKDEAGHGATWNESSFARADWGWKGAILGDVAFGNGNTLRQDAPAEATDEWLRYRLDPRLIGALVAGATHGLLVQEGNGCVTKINQFVASRESANPPYLLVAIDGDHKAQPGGPAQVKVAPAPLWATPDLGAIEVSLVVPAGALGYRVRIDGRAVQRWQLPFAGKAGAAQTFPIRDLQPDADVTVEIAAVDLAGGVSAPVVVKGRTSGRLTVPPLPACDFAPRPGEPKALGSARVWALPEVTKVDPVTGEVLGEEGAKDFRRANPVWDGAAGTIRLAAARGEIVSFQLAVEGQAAGCSIAVSDLAGPGRIANAGVRLWRNWYVGDQSEYALPLTGPLGCPMPDNAVKGQTLQAVTVDCHIPAATPPGDYRGTVTVAAGEAKVELPLRVKVYSAVIGDEIFFNPELNCYGGPGYSNSDKFKDSFRLAHYHRCTINRVPYSQRQAGASRDWSPKLDAAGRIVDWQAFDDGIGPLLDGSLFKDNPRAGVPVPTLYLPFHLGWPLDYRKHYQPGEGLSNYFNNDFLVKLKHDLKARPVEEAFDQAWKDAFQAAVRDFAAHAAEKGWNRTLLQFYNNQKWTYGFSAWTLDEPTVTLDWLALAFLGRVFNEAAADPEIFTGRWHEEHFARGLSGMKRGRATLVYRTDISRPVVQGSGHDGVVAMMYANGGQFAYPRLMRGQATRGPMILYCYGACNEVQRSNWESAAWCLKSYVHYCDGVLPWQSLGGPGAMTKADTGGLIVDTTAGRPKGQGPAPGFGHAVASLRVHALRRGAQDCELLRLLQLKKGWSREQVGMLVDQAVPLTIAFKQAFADEAAATRFGKLTSRGFCELKEGVLNLLEQRP